MAWRPNSKAGGAACSPVPADHCTVGSDDYIISGLSVEILKGGSIQRITITMTFVKLC